MRQSLSGLVKSQSTVSVCPWSFTRLHDLKAAPLNHVFLQLVFAKRHRIVLAYRLRCSPAVMPLAPEWRRIGVDGPCSPTGRLHEHTPLGIDRSYPMHPAERNRSERNHSSAESEYGR